MRFYAVTTFRRDLVLTGRHVYADNSDQRGPALPVPRPPRGLCRRMLLYLYAHEAATSLRLWEVVGAPYGSSRGTVATALSRRLEWFEGGSRGARLGGRAVPWRLTPAGREAAGSLSHAHSQEEKWRR